MIGVSAVFHSLCPVSQKLPHSCPITPKLQLKCEGTPERRRLRHRIRASDSGSNEILVDTNKDPCNEILVCVNKACRKSGSLQVVEYFRCLAPPDVEVVTTGCLGKCGNGPNIVLMPGEVQISHCSTASHIARLLEKQCGAEDAETNLKAFELQSKGAEAYSKGQFEDAERFFTKAIELQPSGGLHNIYCSRSACRTALGDVEGAIEDVQESNKLKPNWGTAMIRLAQALEAGGNASVALETYAKAAHADPEFRRSKLFLRKRKELQALLEGATA